MKAETKQAHQRWEAYKLELKRSTTIPKETLAEKRARISKLEKNPEQWYQYYFPNYYKSESAPFHRRSTNKVLRNNKLFIVRAWARELAKDTRTMFDIFYLMFVKKEATNILLVSHNWDNADKLLEPYKINLEANNRLISDYGQQKNYKNWSSGAFTTVGGIGFTAFGAGQSPRGTRIEANRPDVIIVTDIDTDESARNKERVDDRYKWFEEALVPTVSVSGNWRIIWLNNIIAKHCCTTEAIKNASHVEKINIRDKEGKSTWPAKNSEEDIDLLLNTISYTAAQQEYFNNPITKGTIFKELTYQAVPRSNQMDFIVNYGDPCTSNSDSKKASFKSIVQMAFKDGKYYLLNAFVDQCSSEDFIEAFYTLNSLYPNTPQYNYIENNSLQNPIFEQVYMPMFLSKNSSHNMTIIPKGDARKKPDKYYRIESKLEPLVRMGLLIFNAKLKEDKHIKQLDEQFTLFNAQLTAPADGPDAVEGAIFIIDKLRLSLSDGAVKVFNPKKRLRKNGFRK